MAAGLQLNQLLDKPERLTRLIKSICPFRRNFAAVHCYNVQFFFSDRIVTFCSQLLSQRRIALRILNYCLTAQDHCIQKMRASCIIFIAYLTFVQLRLGLCHNPLITDCKNLFVFYCYMSYTIIKIISRCKNIMFDRPNSLRCHVGSRKFTGCSSLPVFMYLPQLLLCLFGDIKRVRAPRFNRIQLVLQPLIRKLRIGLAPSGCYGTASHDQFLITDNDRNVTQDMSKCLRTPGDHRLSFRFFIGLCKQLRSGRFDHRHFLIQMVNQSCDSG